MPIQLIKRAFFLGGGGVQFYKVCFCFFVVVLFWVFWFFFYFKFCFSIRGPRGGGGCPSPTFVINGSKNEAINSEIEVTKSTCYRISMISIIDLFFFSYFFQIFWMRLPPPTLTKNNARCLVCPWFVSLLY